jgi:V/A-type H+-transporting ATPase subunit C
MSPNPATDFASINARVRAMYSSLLTKQDFVNLSEANDLDTLFGLLKHTAYGPYLERLKDKELNARRAAFLIRSRLSESYHSIINNSPDYTRDVLTQMYRYYEVNNLKAVLRGIITNSDWDKVRFVLFPFGSEGVIPAQAMVESGNVVQAVELLRNTPYYDTLAFAMKRFNVEQSLFPIEVALDLDYWRELWKAVKELPKQDQAYATRILGNLLDMNNLMWAIRYRAYHNLSEEEVINYTLPFGYHVRDEEIRSIAAGAEIAPIVKHVYPSLLGVDEMLADLHSGLPKLELLLEKRIAEQCHACFVGNPFQIGIPLGYLELCDLEIQDLVVLFEAKANKKSSDDYKNYLTVDL